MTQPNFSSNARITSTGIAAPPETHRRKPSSSRAGRLAWRSAVAVSRWASEVMGLCSGDGVVDAGGGHGGPVVVHRVREQDEVAPAAVPVADVVAQQARGRE